MEPAQLIEREVRGIDQWRSTVNELLLPLSVSASDPSTFRARIRRVWTGGVRLFTVTATRHSSARPDHVPADAGDPVFAVVYQVAGRSSIRQHGHTALLEVGEYAVYDSGEPYRREFIEGTTMILLVPQQLVNLPIGAFAKISARGMGPDEGLGGVASPMLAGMAANLDAFARPGGQATVLAAIDIIIASIAQGLEIEVPTRVSSHTETLLAVRGYMMAHLGDPDLTLESVSQAHGISLRTLHSLFKEQGTTASTWIRERRLEMARRDLADPSCEDAIRTIGERWGFVDATHFSNAFKLAYGDSPRRYRQAVDAL